MARARMDTWNSRDRDGYAALYTDDSQVSAPGFTGKGRQGALDLLSVYVTAFPDFRIVPRTVMGDASAGVEECVFEGTHTGPLRSADGPEAAPTGRQVSIGFAGIHSVRSGKILSSRYYFDQLDLLTQLGVLPT
nr:ester cyclase [Pseudonocardia acidicola]